MSVYDWSKTAADNDDADSDINWAEGQAPSTVNNSARAMMQKLAYLRSHMTGQTTSAGSSNAYTLTTGESLSAYPAGFACVFEANHTNTGAATLNVDAIGAKSIKKKHDEALEAGDIESGGLYYVIYDSGDDAFQLISPTATALDSGDIGVTVQAYDAQLADFAGLTQAADTLPYFDTASTMAVATFTSFGRSLVDDADASAARTTLGLGSIATQAASSVSITGGSITGITDLAVADGGTGASTAAGARTNLGLVIGTDVQAWDAALDDFAGLTQAADTLPYFATASTMATTSFTSFARTLLDDADASAARTTLGVAIGTNVQAWDAALDDFAGLTQAADRLPYFDTASTMAVATFTSFGRSLVDDADASAARTTLGLGSIATQAASSVSITGGSISGITDLAVADGGTGASTAADARTNLGLVIGTDIQAYSANLAAIAALAVTDSNIIVGNGSTWVAESGATARTTLGLGSIATQAASSVAITGGAIDGTAIGGTTAAAGAFTTLTASGRVTLSDIITFDAVASPLAGSVSIYASAANQLSLATNGTARINITSAGNVGVGKTPAAAFDVDGDNRGTQLQAINTSAGQFSIVGLDARGPTSLGSQGGLIFGISPRDAGVTQGSILLAHQSATGTFGATVAEYDINANSWAFSTNGSERLRIDSSGNVGVGETSPDYKLDVNGTFGFTPGASVTPVDNGDVVFEATSNTTFTVKLKGSDGTVRSGTVTLS